MRPYQWYKNLVIFIAIFLAVYRICCNLVLAISRIAPIAIDIRTVQNSIYIAFGMFSSSDKPARLVYGFRGLSVEAGLFESTFIYAISSVADALTMLPGGLGVTETSVAGLSSHLFGLDKSASIAETFIIRAVTLWFAVIV